MFIEPSTGTLYPLKESPYLAVESVWNDINYWVNIQSKPVSEMTFNLKDKTAWEYVLIKDKLPSSDDEDSGDLPEVSESIAEETSEVEKSSNSPDDKVPVGAERHDILLEPPPWPTKIEINRECFESIYPEGKKCVYYKRCNVEKYSEHHEGMKGLVLKVTFFHDDARQSIKEVREVFSRRR